MVDETDCVTVHTIAIHDRGGKQRVASLVKLASIQWSRQRSEFTQATVTISAANCESQVSELDAIEADRHELVVFRGSNRVWEGPIREVRWLSNRVEIVADDIGAYIDNSICSKAWPGPEGGGQPYMTERAREIITYELTTSYQMDVGLTVPQMVTATRWEQQTPPANVLPYLDVRASTGVGGLLTTAEVEPFQMMVGEHLRNLARGGLDFTVVGRSLVVWDSATPLGQVRPLTEADFVGEIAVVASGRDLAAIAHIVAPAGGGEEDAPPVVGNAGAPDAYYGPWTRLLTREDEGESEHEPDIRVLNTQARRMLAGRLPVPVEIRADTGLRLSSDLTIDDLVPGVILPVRAVLNTRPVAQDQVLDKVTVNETADGETITVELSPVGTVRAL